jgi:EAL domain-containing protein (putative c-di-GMP-specific phosphodiesterase class I)
MIVPIGEWVLRTACAQNKAWLDAGLAPIPVAVNFSARQFQHADPAAAVMVALQETGLDAELLEIEITESLLMQDTDLALRALERLRRLGARISIDDFGTGYSSLNYLSRLPLEKLKIDRAFVQTITVDPNDRAITSAIIALAHGLGLKPVAEGVETGAQLNALRALNCRHVQGFYFSRPLSAAAVARYFAARQTHLVNGARGIAAPEADRGAQRAPPLTRARAAAHTADPAPPTGDRAPAPSHRTP